MGLEKAKVFTYTELFFNWLASVIDLFVDSCMPDVGSSYPNPNAFEIFEQSSSEQKSTMPQ